jgi:hypothetical protein
MVNNLMKEIELPFDVELLPVTNFKAGSLDCLYEAGNLRYIKCDGIEIIRLIYSALRDETWQTIPPAISGEKVEMNESGFSITYMATYQAANIQYRAEFAIKAKNNIISFSMKGEALSDFKRNRIGLCLLHPIKRYTSRKVTITRPDGSTYESAFPELVSPHQPFLEIQKMNYSLHGIGVEIRFEGDIFETEDQRNWSDSSYKTYSTPLRIPIPALIKAGEKIEQRITISVSGRRKLQMLATTGTFYEEKLPFPEIGYSRGKNQPQLTSTQVKRFKSIPFNHYRVELRLYESSWKDILSAAASEAELLHTKLELITFYDDNYDEPLNELVASLKPLERLISSILLLSKNLKITPTELMEKGYATIKQSLPAIQIGYGTDGYFADLNRNLPQQISYDFVSYSLNPQVHATDTRTVIENLASQEDAIKKLYASIGNKRIHVSPVTLKMRKNSEAIVDERQHTSFAAFWTLLTVQNLSGANLTLYELTGDRGILDETKPSPVYEALKMIKAFDTKWIIRRFRNGELIMDDFMIENEQGERMIFKCQLLSTVTDLFQ